MSAKLESIRARLQEGEEAWGPSSEPETAHAEGEPGESDATNVSDVLDVFDSYILSVVDAILDEWDMTEDEAVEAVFDVAASLEEDGSLPPMPEEDNEVAVAEWVGKAKTMGFADLVLAALDAEEDEVDSEE
jgi:hypothetical protein